MNGINRRILIIDDNSSIHEDFRKILCRECDTVDDLLDELFGDESPRSGHDFEFEIESAMQGSDGLRMVAYAQSLDRFWIRSRPIPCASGRSSLT
ncbi:MAG: hypothetical protein WD875_06460 [Pirellulales bacterium]